MADRRSYMRRAAAIFALAALAGCGRPIDASSDRAEAPRLQRLTAVTLERLRSSRRDAHDAIAPKDSEPDRTRRLDRAETPHSLIVPIDIDANDFSELRIAMRADAGEICRVYWEGDFASLTNASGGARIRILADDAFHTYRVELNPAQHPEWAGRISRLRIVPSNKPANVEITSIKIVYKPPAGPRRVTIDGTALEAVEGTPEPWRVTIPPNGMFEAYAGVIPVRGRGLGDRPKFEVTATDEAGKTRLLAREDFALSPWSASKTWKRMTADLNAYSGQTIELQFAVSGVTRGAAHVFFGDPIVYSGEPDPGAVPVVLISCDTTRADHLSCYGYARATTPHLDEWTAEAVVFENATTEETWTLPAHVTMLTGLHPNRHGATANANLAEEVETLSEVLGNAGYLSAAFASSHLWFLPERGVSHGFNYYDFPTADPHVRDVFSTHHAVARWLDQHDYSRVFLFVHNIDMHAHPGGSQPTLPYGPDDPRHLHFSSALGERPELSTPGPNRQFGWAFLDQVNRGNVVLTEYEKRYIEALYDDSIRSVDIAIHELFEDLKRRGLYDNALIIVTADHGEELFDRGTYGHGTVYRECARVPLLIRFPGGRFGGTRFDGAVQLSDVYPTILDVLGLPVDGAIDGRSMLGMIEGRVPARDRTYVQRYFTRAAQSGRWKLVHDVHNGSYELYNLDDDPGETMDVIGARQEEKDAIAASMRKFFAPSADGWHMKIAAPDAGKRRTISLTTEGRIEEIHTLLTDRVNDRRTTDSDAYSARIDWSKIVSDEIVFRTVPADARSILSIDADSEFRVVIDNATTKPAKRFEAVLDANELAGAMQPQAPPPEDAIPVITIWHSNESPRRSPMRDLTPDESAELKATGYLK